MIRPSAILLAALLALSAIIGIGRADVTLCLGHLHDHDHAPALPAPDACCDHQHDDGCGSDEWQLHGDDHAGCCCHDVELPDVEFQTAPRSDEFGPSCVALTAFLELAGNGATSFAWRGPPRPPGFDPGVDRRLTLVRTTRLIL